MPPRCTRTKACKSIMVGPRKSARRKCEYFILCNLICCSIIYLIFINTNNTGIPISVLDYDGYDLVDVEKLETNLSRILFWTGVFETYNLLAFGIGKNTFKDCPVKCEFTFDRRIISVSNAVIFHVRDISKVGMPSYHDKNQVWVFFVQESSENTCLDLRPYKNIFNWTMTHRMDSDIYHPYSRIFPVNMQSTLQKSDRFVTSDSNSKILKMPHARRKQLVEKPDFIAWVVSNCYTHSNRESFVRELEKYISIDIFGLCGRFKCASEQSLECYEDLAKTYKFYFAFENSLCVDYVTEKFFDALSFDMVPVVYGNANYSEIAPPNSYIDARKFASAEMLSQYLLYLNAHPAEYLKYFIWKQQYRIVPSNGWCSLCTKLSQKLPPKSYKNIYKWWHNRPGFETRACLPYPDYPNEYWVSKYRKRYFILQ